MPRNINIAIGPSANLTLIRMPMATTTSMTTLMATADMSILTDTITAMGITTIRRGLAAAACSPWAFPAAWCHVRKPWPSF